ncbi:hypothetical protein [Sphingomonas hengshuiensis]|uniref:Uncharacterized protein n=1 Tax=Sphingomonas hengshuiensis TaxID=1609977 RepID=A0A7U4J9V7_9SPHN|nr:hypothetical protein [Sphingomonas hengshuiensis]AJP72940.1 hypothetical protein TS85_15790 [Sphingomonas hengshuiensis]
MAEPIVDQLERASADLDKLIHDMRLRTYTAREYDAFEASAQAIATGIVTPFRGSAARPATIKVTPGRNGGVWV